MDKVIVFINSTLHHFSQLLAGMEFLSAQKKISLQYVLDLGKYPADIFRIEINGLNVFLDLSDNSRIYKTLYEQSDFYVKRMLLQTDFETMDKLIPYGLYYPVYYKNKRLKYLFLKDYNMLKFSLKYWSSFSWILNIKDCIAVNEISKIESKPDLNTHILFRARLWNPANNETKWKKDERLELNYQRTEINRLLKKEFPSNFSGGILKDSFSEKECPDLLLPEKEYHRKKYIKKLKTSSIGVVNPGLEDSIGAKMGEYVANSLAIVTSSIQKFKLQGDFKEGENYLTFSDEHECLDLTKKLVKNKSLRNSLQLNNRKYYSEFLHPGKKVFNILYHITNP